MTKSIRNAGMHLVMEFGVDHDGVVYHSGVGVRQPQQDCECSESNEQGLNYGVKPHKCFGTGFGTYQDMPRGTLVGDRGSHGWTSDLIEIWHWN